MRSRANRPRRCSGRTRRNRRKPRHRFNRDARPKRVRLTIALTQDVLPKVVRLKVGRPSLRDNAKQDLRPTAVSEKEKAVSEKEKDRRKDAAETTVRTAIVNSVRSTTTQMIGDASRDLGAARRRA